jgi:8-oxo-dGTP pyrophosphatase MutT (NUDIX family)
MDRPRLGCVWNQRAEEAIIMLNAPTVKEKVLVYIFRRHGPHTAVLVFEHADFPEAGIQVPAGTLEPGEDPADGALREAHEESGLSGLSVERFIGVFDWLRTDLNQLHHRHVYILSHHGPVRDAWEHVVTAGEEDEGLRYRFYWLATDVAKQELSADQGAYIDLALSSRSTDPQ